MSTGTYCWNSTRNWAGDEFQFVKNLREHRKLVPVEGLVEGLFPGQRIEYPMDVFVRVGVVIVVLDDKVRAGYPANE